MPATVPGKQTPSGNQQKETSFTVAVEGFARSFLHTLTVYSMPLLTPRITRRWIVQMQIN